MGGGKKNGRKDGVRKERRVRVEGGRERGQEKGRGSGEEEDTLTKINRKLLHTNISKCINLVVHNSYVTQVRYYTCVCILTFALLTINKKWHLRIHCWAK